MKRPLIICATLAVITFGLYAGVFQNAFVDYDDGDYILNNEHVQGGITWPCIEWAFTSGHASNWHPLTWLSHALDCQWHGLKPAGHHATSLFLHIADSLLVYLVLRRMTGKEWRSAMVAALFAWHPLHVESVAWVSERKDVLSAFFWLLTMWLYAEYVGEVKMGGKRRRLYYALALVSFALGLMSKPMLVTLPFVLLLLDWWPLTRGSEFKVQGSKLEKGGTEAGAGETWRAMILEKIPFLALALVSSVVTFLVQQKGGAVAAVTVLSASQRLGNAVVSYLRYVGKTVWPADLSVLYPHPGTWPISFVAVSAAFLIGVSVAAWMARRRSPYCFVGWFWFLGTLVPVIGLVQVGIQSMADRYMYIPSIGLFIAFVWGATELVRKWEHREKALAVSGVAALAVCLPITHEQVGYWKDSEALFGRAVAVTKDNYLAYNNLGFYLANHGRIDEAMEDYKKSLAINSNYEEARNNLGFALAKKGRNAEAVEQYELALRVKPEHVDINNNLGNALSELGRLDEAVVHYRIALSHDPNHVDAHMNLGVALAMQGKLDEAVKELKEAVRLRPKYVDARTNLGNALAAQRRFAEAAEQYGIALELSPNDARTHNNLGNVLVEQGKIEAAAVHYRRAVELNRDNPEANYNLGLVSLKMGKRDEAVGYFREALRLRPNYPEAKRQLAALGIGVAK